MLFGTYLLEKDQLTTEQLVESLIWQLDNLPPLLSVIYERGIFNAEKILSIIRLQIEESSDLLSVMEKHNFLTKEKLRDILSLQAKKRIPLGQILVKKKILTIRKAQNLLSDFLNEHRDTVSIVESQNKNEPEEPGKEIEKNSKNPSFEFEKELDQPPLEESLTNEYMQVFDEEKKDSLELAILEWKKAFSGARTHELKDFYRTYYRELHTIKGTARFLKANISEYFIHRMEDLLSAIQQAQAGLNKDDCDKIESHFLQGLDIVWALRNEMGKNLSEKELWFDSDWKKAGIVYLNKTVEMNTRFSQIEIIVSEEEFGDQF